MTIKSFLKLVELPTKVASVFPFLIGTTYAVYRYGKLDAVNLAIMLVAMLCLDMATTALNNYMDYKLAIKTHGFNYEQHNAIVKYELSEKTVKGTIFILAFSAMLLGLWLFVRTDIIVLLLGMASFFFAAIYTWGPLPISRTPLGEAVSGTVMGGIITFISLYIHIHELGLIAFHFTSDMFMFKINWIELMGIFVLALPLMTGIANIMLANNTCDMADDYENRRFTLPLVIGKKNALRLFVMLYALGYIGIAAGMVFSWLPVTCLIVFATVVPVRKNIMIFFGKQTKAETFVTAVQNFILISAVYFISLLAGLLLK